MKQIKKILFLAFTLICFFSCYNNAFNEILFRTTNDPFDDKPTADSLRTEHTVYLSWKEDAAADSFCLMRSFDTVPLGWSCIYEGNATSYTDEQLPDKDLYIYRLDKIRGSKYFEGKEYAYGFSLDGRKDRFEPNDKDIMATNYKSPMSCTLPCVCFKTNNKTIIDADWFSINLSPYQSAHIVIRQTNFTKPDDSTYLKYQELGKESESVTSGHAKVISNSSLEPQTLYFKIYPETTELISGSNGIALIQYTITCSNWTAYSVGGGS
jgi:hypothetical protein